jgi:hypothetical protein
MRRAARAASPLVVGIAAVAFLARLLPVLRGGGLMGVLAYDDGVYFGGAEALVFGRLPYRDFLLLHPPGILLALSPFGLLARWTTDSTGLAVARLAFMAVGALNATLAYRVGRRLGPVAAVTAGLFYALWQPAVYAERTTLLEPLVNLGVLASLLLLGDGRSTSRRQAVAAGAALGLATAVKLWAVVPLGVLLGWLLLRRRRSAALPYAVGAAAAAAAVCLPFFVLAPARMMRLVVLDQLGRTNNGISTWDRLAGMTEAGVVAHVVGAQLPLLTAALSVLGGLAAALVTWRCPPARPWCALLAAQTALLLSGPSYFSHYATYVAPALALVVGAAADLARRALRSRARVLQPVAVATGVLAALALALVTQLHPEGRTRPDRQVRTDAASVRCVAADTPAILEVSDLLAHDLRNGCAVLVDPTGLTYDQDHGDLAAGNTVVARRADVEWQHRLTRYFARSEAVILQRGDPDGLSLATLRSVARQGSADRHRRYTVYLLSQ